MKELALNILDIAKNSVKAGAAHIGISIVEEGALRTLTIRDDGSGIPEEMLRNGPVYDHAHYAAGRHGAAAAEGRGGADGRSR